MKLIDEKGPWPRLLVFPFLIVAIIGLGFARWYPDLTYRLAFCPLRETTGIPCLTCGGTHSMVALMRGDVLEAMVANPLVFFGALVFGIWVLYALLATALPRLRKSLEMSSREKNALKIILILISTVTWSWLFFQYR